MAEPVVKHRPNGARDQSLGTLVSQAIGDVSLLLKSEIDLAKLELRKDAVRLGIGGALLGIAAFVGCLILIFAGFGYAYGLSAALAIPLYAGFFCTAGTCAFVAVVAILIGRTRFRKLSGLQKTRRTVQDDLALLKREDTAAVPVAPGDR
jgi:membrane protein implicated in regulation of membrane protease activity